MMRVEQFLIYLTSSSDISYETSGGRRDEDWIRFLYFLTGYTGLTGFFRLRRVGFGRRPHYPDDPVDPVQFF
jgi:hypothetical protein